MLTLSARLLLTARATVHGRLVGTKLFSVSPPILQTNPSVPARHAGPCLARLDGCSCTLHLLVRSRLAAARPRHHHQHIPRARSESFVCRYTEGNAQTAPESDISRAPERDQSIQRDRSTRSTLELAIATSFRRLQWKKRQARLAPPADTWPGTRPVGC